ncbi:MAG: glycosyltransferase [Acidobacteriota bacterium]
MATVHVITVHHRGRAMLERCLTSALGSHSAVADRVDIVVVSNDCQEPMPDVVAASPRVHLVETGRPIGFAHANNLGVAWARRHLGEADYYYFINNDTASTPDALDGQVRALRAHPDAAIAGPQLRILGAPDHLNSLGLNITEDAWGWDEGIGLSLDTYGALPSQRSVAAVTGSALLMDAAVFRAVGGWTELYDYYFEDIDLCFKTWSRGHAVLHVPEAIVYHQISATITVGSERKYFFFWRNRLLLAMVHWPPSLLTRTLWRALWQEIVRRPWSESALQRRAMRGMLAKLPRLVAARLRQRRRRPWRRFLVPPGSVPVITLPPTDDDAFDLANPSGAPEAVDDAAPDATDAEAADAAQPRVDDPHDARWRDARACRDAARAQATEQRPAGAVRILVLGWSPLPFEPARMNYAPGARTWQLARALLDAGQAVCVACARIPGAEADPADAEIDAAADADAVDARVHGGAPIYSMARDVFESSDALPRLIAAFEPDALIAVSAVPGARAVAVAGDRPLWIDLFGDPMAEAQAKGVVDGRDAHLLAYQRLVLPQLQRGDQFSTVSDRQRWAAYGQLGLAGRLNTGTAGETLVVTVPCAVPDTDAPEAAPAPDVDAPEAARAADDAQPAYGDAWLDDPEHTVVLWSGGYNTWCDTDILFAALERVMAAHPKLVFLSTGGHIAGHDDDTYSRFRARVAASRFRDRFRLKGRLPTDEAARFFRRADVGLVTEKALVERQLGSSGRVLRWLRDGLPVICADLSELATTLAAADAALVYRPGDEDDLVRVLTEALNDPTARAARAVRGQGLAHERFSITATAAPLVRWAAAPTRAPDADAAADRTAIDGDVLTQLADLQQALRDADAERTHLTGDLDAARAARDIAHAQRAAYDQERHALRAELGTIQTSRMWGTWMAYLRLRSIGLAPFAALGWLLRLPLRAVGAARDRLRARRTPEATS